MTLAQQKRQEAAEKYGSEKLALIQKAINYLEEHFDCVQIFASTVHNGDTASFDNGSGNMFARERQVQRWLNKSDENE